MILSTTFVAICGTVSVSVWHTHLHGQNCDVMPSHLLSVQRTHCHQWPGGDINIEILLWVGGSLDVVPVAWKTSELGFMLLISSNPHQRGFVCEIIDRQSMTDWQLPAGRRQGECSRQQLITESSSTVSVTRHEQSCNISHSTVPDLRHRDDHM